MSEQLEQITVGSIVEGKVVRIKDFGAIVALGDGKQGLVHISEVANSYVKDINDHLKVNDIVKVKVLSIDEQTKRISLSIRAALPKPETPQHQNNYKQRDSKPNYENKNREIHGQSTPNPLSDFEEKMKEFLKQSNEKQAGLNKRANKRQ